MNEIKQRYQNLMIENANLKNNYQLLLQKLNEQTQCIQQNDPNVIKQQYQNIYGLYHNIQLQNQRIYPQFKEQEQNENEFIQNMNDNFHKLNEVYNDGNYESPQQLQETYNEFNNSIQRIQESENIIINPVISTFNIKPVEEEEQKKGSVLSNFMKNLNEEQKKNETIQEKQEPKKEGLLTGFMNKIKNAVIGEDPEEYRNKINDKTIVSDALNIFNKK